MIPGFYIHDFYEVSLFSIILSLLNSIARPVLKMLTFSVTFLSLAIFTLVVDVLTFWIAGQISYGVYIEALSAVLWGGLIIWATGILTNRYIWHVNIY